ncbi:oxidoreductase [Nocardioides speluncae]|uniref:oxidoreductase n=1 Tax=Nocardioides speluncae TaxID=2670337 RepID=UPI000D69DC1F|nr:oxidoreductase [Nocardioides speluncae]
MPKWTASDIPDQTGRTFVVTGANSGLGAAAAEALGVAGARVVLACRSTAKAEPVAARIGDNAEVRALDLADLSSVRAFAEGIDKVDVLINNAGIMAVPEGRTADGFEMQIGTNHLGHFALTGLLLDRIGDRIVTLSSDAHNVGTIHVDDLNWERRRYDRWRAYGQSKLANLLFTYELDRKLHAAGSSVLATAAHPGYAATGLQAHTGTFQDKVMAVGNRILAQSAEMGALPSLYAATSPDAVGGGYYGPDGFRQLRGYPKKVGSNAKSRDEAMAGKLWELSEKLTGVTFKP